MIYKNKDKINIDSWLQLVEANETASFFQTPGAYNFFDLSNETEAFVIAVGENDKISGLITGIIIEEKGWLKARLTKRAIVFGGPLLAENISKRDLNVLLEIMFDFLSGKAIYIEIRNFRDFSKYKEDFVSVGFKYVLHLNFHVDCIDKQDMERRISKSKKRQIKKSLKEGAEIIVASTKEDVLSFYNILNNLYKTKIKTPLFSKTFFLNFFQQKLGVYLLVKYREEIIGGIMCPILDNRVIYEWFVCGKDGKYPGIYPSILATWAAMDYANNHGIEYFDFMGAGSPDSDYGVREFKSKFGGKLVEYGRYLYIKKPIFYNLGKVGVKILKRFK